MKRLHVYVISGLASRMRAVVGALCWAKNHGAQVNVHWPWEDTSEDLGVFPVKFSDLFDSTCEETIEPHYNPGGWPKVVDKWHGEYAIRTCEPANFGVDRLDRTGWPYCDDWKPSAMTREIMHSLQWPYRAAIVGVHIRRKNAQPEAPPTEWFLQRMASMKSAFIIHHFFLSCDHPEVEREVKAAFPETICFPKTYQYDELGIFQAAADLFLLQRCNWMIGCFDSSYSELAGWMRGGQYIFGRGDIGWMPGGRFENFRTPPNRVELEASLERRGLHV